MQRARVADERLWLQGCPGREGFHLIPCCGSVSALTALELPGELLETYNYGEVYLCLQFILKQIFFKDGLMDR